VIPYFEQPSLSLGIFSIHAFGVLLAVAVWTGHRVFQRRVGLAGLDRRLGDRFLLWILLGGFVGAHMVDRLVYFPRETLADPLSLLRFWSGISSFGGFIGAIAGAWLFIRRGELGEKTWQYLDAVAYAFPFGWIFGRLGCFVAFDHPGLPTHSFLGQKSREGVVIHNLGLEEALFTMALAAVFLVLGRRPRFAGFFVGLLPLLYAPFRFLADFLRTGDARYLGYTPGQYGTVALLIVGGVLLRLRRPAVES
jgi:phosphatidylglycerol:prolipoprotein diacylglycerol transferase